MKKLIFALGAIALLAASCNVPGEPLKSGSQESSTKGSVEGAINELNASIDSEEKINSGSDEDIISSDKQIITDYEGVSNANY